MVIVVIFYCKRKKNSPLSLAIAETQSLSPLAPSRARPSQLVYLSKVWLSATHGSVDRTSPFLSRSAASLVNSFSNFSICDRFLRGAIVASHPVGTRPDQFAHFSRRHRLMIRPSQLGYLSNVWLSATHGSGRLHIPFFIPVRQKLSQELLQLLQVLHSQLEIRALDRPRL